MIAYSVFLGAYNYSFAEFPIYRAFGVTDDQSEKMLKACGIGLVQVTGVYFISGVLAIYHFGSSLQESVLDNVAAEGSTVGTVIQLLFLVILACHIPYVFMLCKDGGNTFYEELMNSSMSNTIRQKMEGSHQGYTRR